MSNLPRPKALPFQFGNGFDQPLHFLTVPNGLTHPVLQNPGDTHLANLARLTLNQIQRTMQLATGAMATGLPAFAGAL